MEGNFLSRLENNISELTEKIEKDPEQKREHESELGEYL